MRLSDQEKKSKFELRVNVGTTSILLIFVTLCLVSFAVLSIVSANADAKLTRKVTERSSQYYAACMDAELRISQIDAILLRAYQEAADETAFYNRVDATMFFSIPLNDSQELFVELLPHYPSNESDALYQISIWEIRSISGSDVIIPGSVTFID